ncbi:MAG: universal stress protein [Deltaproteobacteria bacterium]|nr:universal stress protein [Deltaproteobacteria bacterium]
MRILLAIDGSPGSEAAIEEISRRPWPPDSEVRVITVISPLESMLMKEAAQYPPTYDDIFEHQSLETARHLSEIAAAINERSPDLQVTPVLREGRPKEAILEEAENWGADLIVVGSHGYGPVKRFFLGSVSLAIALHAPCSVEIVRRPPVAHDVETK